LSKLSPNLQLIEKVSPAEFTPQHVGACASPRPLLEQVPDGPEKLIVGSTLLVSTAPKFTFVWELNSSLISPIHPIPSVITSWLEMALEYVRKNPVPSLG